MPLASFLRRILALFLVLVPLPALAEPPRVLVDTAPLHSLVAMVTGDAAAPALLLPPGASPHDYALRPSDARALAGADLVFWVGAGLTPWLEEPLGALAGEAVVVEMLATGDWDRLARREDAGFGAEHDHAGDAGEVDPHAWLDPDVAAVWLGHIAEALATADPAGAQGYRANATAARARLQVLGQDIAGRMAPLAGRPFVVPHDAYHYFEARFGVEASAAISLSDAAAPGPARIAALRDMVRNGAIVCVFTDPQTSPAWSQVLRDGTGAATALIDPDGGAGLAPGPELYPALLEALAAAFVDCLG